jgi:hypothetical protein
LWELNITKMTSSNVLCCEICNTCSNDVKSFRLLDITKYKNTKDFAQAIESTVLQPQDKFYIIQLCVKHKINVKKNLGEEVLN